MSLERERERERKCVDFAVRAFRIVILEIILKEAMNCTSELVGGYWCRACVFKFVVFFVFLIVCDFFTVLFHYVFI